MSEESLAIWLAVWAPAQGESFDSGRAFEERVCELYNARVLYADWWYPGLNYKTMIAVAVAHDWLHTDKEGRTVVTLPLIPVIEPQARERVSALAG